MAKGSSMRGNSNARRNSAISLLLVVILIVCAGYVALNGFGQGSMIRYMQPWHKAITLGLDLRGGVYTVYQAKAPEGVEATASDFDGLLHATMNVLGDRLTKQGFTEATVAKQGTDRIRVEIPGVDDPNKILDIIGTPAHLEFKDPEGNVVIEGKDILTAQTRTSNGQFVVAFKLTDEGGKAFAESTAKNIGKAISIVMDGNTISSPTVNSVIPNGEGIIEVGGKQETADALALQIQSGALPLHIEQLEMSAISATLGVEALDRALLAGVIGLALVMLFMLIRYRLPGLVACIALSAYVLLVIFFLAVFGSQLTLPGVAGIVLGIGMAVDANIIIFERFREEVRGGRAQRAAG